jgi:hypothetical protein
MSKVNIYDKDDGSHIVYTIKNSLRYNNLVLSQGHVSIDSNTTGGAPDFLRIGIGGVEEPDTARRASWAARKTNKKDNSDAAKAAAQTYKTLVTDSATDFTDPAVLRNLHRQVGIILKHLITS